MLLRFQKVCQEIARQRFSGSQPNWTQPDYSGDKDDRRAANRIASEFDRYGTNYRDAINALTRQSSIALFEGIHGVLDVFGCDDCVAYEDRNGSSSHQSSRSEEHTSELQSPVHLVCRLLLEKKNYNAGTSAMESIFPNPTDLFYVC